MKQNADKARALSEVELEKQLKDGAEQMFRLRFQLSMGQADGLKKLRQLRKERARILTIQREKQIGAMATAPTAVAPTKQTAKAAKSAKPVAKKPAKPVAVAPADAAAKKPAVKKAVAKKAAPKKTASPKMAAKE